MRRCSGHTFFVQRLFEYQKVTPYVVHTTFQVLCLPCLRACPLPLPLRHLWRRCCRPPAPLKLANHDSISSSPHAAVRRHQGQAPPAERGDALGGPTCLLRRWGDAGARWYWSARATGTCRMPSLPLVHDRRPVTPHAFVVIAPCAGSRSLSVTPQRPLHELLDRHFGSPLILDLPDPPSKLVRGPLPQRDPEVPPGAGGLSDTERTIYGRAVSDGQRAGARPGSVAPRLLPALVLPG